MRCPQCFEVFDVNLIDIRSLDPQFKCSSCDSFFELSLRNEIDFSQTQLAKPVSSSPAESKHLKSDPILHKVFAKCPKCSEPYAQQDKECHRCGVVFESLMRIEHRKLSDEQSTSIYASSVVKDAWEDVLLNYENIELHQNFIAAAWADGSLDYASAKYKEMSELIPGDAVSKQLLAEIKALADVSFENQSETNSKSVSQENIFSSILEGLFNFRDLNLSFKRMKLANVITNIILIGCGVVIAMGILLPHLRNLIGFGVSLLFLVLALRFFVRVI